MNNSIKETQHFILNLISTYKLISEQLQKLNSFKMQDMTLLSELTTRIITCNCIDRGIRRQNELRLFNDTYKLIKDFVHNKANAKKSEIAMKFSIVSEVLATRLKELLVVQAALKTQILQKIKGRKQDVLNWVQRKLCKSEASTEARKETDSYVLKYVFTDTSSRPTTANISKCTSAMLAPPSDLQPVDREPPKKQINNKTQNRNIVTRGHKRVQQQRKTQVIQRPRPSYPLKKQKISRTLKQKLTVCPTEISKQNGLLQGSSDTLNVEEKQNEKQILAQRHKKGKKCLTIQAKLAMEDNSKEDQEKTESHLNESAKFYVSQNYIKSRNNIDGGTTYRSKLKKRSGIISQGLSEYEEPSETSRSKFEEPNEIVMKPRKAKHYYTRPHVKDANDDDESVKSQKMIPRTSELELKELIQKNGRKVFRRSTNFSKSRSSKCSILSVRNHKDSQILKRSNFYQLKLQNQHDVLNEDKISDKTCQNFGDFYNQLKSMRKNVYETRQYWSKDFSIFFWQQHLLSQIENKKIQKILAERKNDCIVRQFEMKVSTSKQKPSYIDNYHEDAYIMGMRKHMTECHSLGQNGPTHG